MAAGGIPPLIRDAQADLMGAQEVEVVTGVPLTPPVSDAGAPQRTIIVRQGSRWESYVKVQPVASRPDAEVQTATRTCDRRSSGWRCSYQLNSDPASAGALGLPETGWSAAGRQVVLGQPCQGYGYTAHTGILNQRFIYWVNPSTHRFVLSESYQRAASSSPSAAALNAHVRAPFLRWNDPSLRALIPRVPGLPDGVVP